MTTSTDMPKELSDLLAEGSAAKVVRLDVRDDLRSGSDPFKKIMLAVDELTSGDVLVIRNIIEPVPLYSVLGSKGLEHWTEKLGEQDWQVYFFVPAIAATGSETGSTSTPEQTGEGLGEIFRKDNITTIDVRNLEPPEPFQRTMELVHDMKDGDILVQINDRQPQLLFPKLDALDLKYEVEEHDDIVKTVIRK